MGNQLGADRPAHHDYDLSDLGLVYDSRLGNGMFLKTIKCLHDEGAVVVKVYTKRPKENLAEHAKALSEIRDNMQLVSTPNVFPYQKFIETEKAGYLVRQYFLNNLYDRISTRPFLSMIEKKWISFQLLFALSQIHFYGICHGDVKSENVLVTSSNWVYLSDFAPYKPTFIPDNPAYFSFFFDSSGRRTCYLAPERLLYDKTMPEEGDLTYQMDIFGMGCVIAELFLEGVPIFEYHQLLSYRKGEYNPAPVIQRINDSNVEQMILHMIQKDPTQRLSASNYLLNWSRTVFPEYFQFMHKHVHQLLKMTSDDRIVCIDANFDNYIKIITKQFSEEPQPTDTPRGASGEQSNAANDQPTPLPKNDAFSLLMETEKFIKHHEALQKTQTGSFMRSPSQSQVPSSNQPSSNSSSNSNSNPTPNSTSEPNPTTTEPTKPEEGRREFNFPEILPTIRHDIKALSPYDIIDDTPAFVPPTGCEGLTIFLGIVCSCMRAARLPSSKITALDLLRRFAIYLHDECRLQRIVPYVVTMLSDPQALVRATAIRTLAYVLDLVRTFPPSDSHIFPEYIFPALSHFPGEEAEEIVRVAFAGSLAQLAETSKRFLEASQFFKQTDVAGTERKDISYQASYDKELISIQDMVYDLVVEMLTKDTSSVVRRTLLTDITRVALFFGRQKTNDQVLPLIITFLNDRDWLLRCAFFHNIVGVSAFVGRSSLELFILPCIMQALTDEEEFVIEKSISCLACLCELGLFRKHILLEIVHKTSPLLLHPNTWVRYGTMAIMEAVCKQLGLADIHCFVHPLLQPFLSYDVLDVNEQNLLLCLIPPVTRSSFDKAVDLMFDFEGRTGPGSDTIPIRRDSIYKVRSQPSDVGSIASAPQSSVQNSLNSSGVFSLENSVDGSPPKNQAASKKVFIGSQRRDSVDEAPPDLHAILFTTKLEGLGITKDDQAKLLKMRDYLNSMTRAMYSRPKKSEDEELIARENSKHYSHTSAPVHVVSIPQPEAPTNTPQSSTSYAGQKLDSAKPDLRYDNFNEYFSQVSREPTYVHVPTSSRNSVFYETRPPASIRVPRINSPGFFEIREEGPPPVPAEQAASRSSLLPPPHIPDLGALEIPPLSGEGLKDLKPKGILVAHLHEHKGPVVQVKVSSDNLFFATCSHDGTVKIWDCQRLEKNVTNRSRLTYSSQGGKITSLAICDNSHSIASASDQGSIHVYKIECAGKREQSGVHRYSGTSTIKNIEKTDPVVWVDHMEGVNQSMIVYATERGGIHSWDLRSKTEPFLLKNKPNLGLVQVCCVDPQRNWIVAATSRGFITCWDLRFGIPISTWRHPSKGRIYKMAPYVSSSPYSAQPRNSWIYISTQGRDGVSVWDLESATCKMIFRVLTNEEEPPLPAVRPVPTPMTLDYGLEDLQIPSPGGPDTPYFVRGLTCAPNGGYLVTAGSDKRVRFWDLLNASNSCTVSGLRPEHPKPRYACSNNLIEGVNVFEEFPDVFFNQLAPNSSTDSSLSSVTSSNPASTSLSPNTSVVPPGASTVPSAAASAAQAQAYAQKQSKHRGPPVPSPNHTDAILDVNLIELPHAMIVSCSRDGVVKVWK